MYTIGLAVLLGSSGWAQVTRRVSVGTAGGNAPSGNPNWSPSSSISDDGRYVAFSSDASDLVTGDTNSARDIFVRDRVAGTIERVSVATGGGEANSGSDFPCISGDGRFVAFQSTASNLVAGDTNGVLDVFVHDRQTGTTERVSVATGGGEGNGMSGWVSISADGRYVAFISAASNLVSGDTNGTDDIFVRDRQSGTTERVNVSTGGGQANSVLGGELPTISADGRYVTFDSAATNLVPGDTNGMIDVFLRDRVAGTTERVSVATNGAEGDSESYSQGLGRLISSDGRYVAFMSDAHNFGVSGNGLHVYVRDRQSGTTECVSVDGTFVFIAGNPSISSDGRYVTWEVGTSSNPMEDVVLVRDRVAGTTATVSVGGGSGATNYGVWSAISPDGRWVAFYSISPLVTGDTNGYEDVFVRDLQSATTELESVGPGVQGNADSTYTAMSSDGRYVAFESAATDLVPNDTNGAPDVFVRDCLTGTTERVSVVSGGAQANGGGANLAISADGRYVAFDSYAGNLVAGDTNSASDIFVHDRTNGTTERVNVSTGGAEANSPPGGGSFRPAISADGRFVAFESDATNLATGDTNGQLDVFVRDRQLGTTERVSVSSGGVQGNNFSYLASISADGRYVAFQSYADNLVASDTNGQIDVFVRDRQAGTTELASVSSGGVQGNGQSFVPSISSNGRYVAFASDSSNLVAVDTNGTNDIFVRDRQAGTTERVSVDSVGTQANEQSLYPCISAGGRFVAFYSKATNLVAGDVNGFGDIFLRDRQTGATTLVSVDSSGAQGNGDSSTGTAATALSPVSADGRFITWVSSASNLVTGDTNGAVDVFLRDRGTESAFASFCFGDGTGAPCPCSNSGAAGHGCENSSSTGGALLTASGVASLASDSVHFVSSGEKPTATSVLLQGTLVVNPIHYGDGLRCAGGALKRLFTHAAAGGVVTIPQGADSSVSAASAAKGDIISVGSTRNYQVYYRDPSATFCPAPSGSTYNISNAIAVAWGT